MRLSSFLEGRVSGWNGKRLICRYRGRRAGLIQLTFSSKLFKQQFIQLRYYNYYHHHHIITTSITTTTTTTTTTSCCCFCSRCRLTKVERPEWNKSITLMMQIMIIVRKWKCVLFKILLYGLTNKNLGMLCMYKSCTTRQRCLWLFVWIMTVEQYVVTTVSPIMVQPSKNVLDPTDMCGTYCMDLLYYRTTLLSHVLTKLPHNSWTHYITVRHWHLMHSSYYRTTPTSHALTTLLHNVDIPCTHYTTVLQWHLVDSLHYRTTWTSHYTVISWTHYTAVKHWHLMYSLHYRTTLTSHGFANLSHYTDISWIYYTIAQHWVCLQRYCGVSW